MSSSSWEPYSSNPPVPISGSITSTVGGSGTNPGLSAALPPISHSNGPGINSLQLQGQHDAPRGNSLIHLQPPPQSIHHPQQSHPQPSVGYPPAPVGSYLHHSPYSHHQGHQPTLQNSYPPNPGVGPPVIHPYPPPVTVSANSPHHYNHHNIPPHHHHGIPGPLPPPIGMAPSHYPPNPYSMPPHTHGQGIPHQPPISPTHTTATPQSVVHTQHQTGVVHHGPISVGGAHHGQPFHLKNQAMGSPQPAMGPMTPGPGPVPQTPLGPPSGGNPFGANGPEMDLHPELVAIGWRKFWSKRESRWYFWNCTTTESLWEVPPLPGRHPPNPTHSGYDMLTDPLGISGHNGPVQLAGVKRRSSSGEHMGPAVKKFILAGPWDMEIQSNVFSSESVIPNPNLLPPHPEVELTRYQLVAKLRQCFQQSCQSREGIDAPKDSMNRWFVERKVNDPRGIDPIFPNCEATDGVVSQVMFKEIMSDIPMKVVKPRFTGDARKQLSKFAEACKKIIETRNATAEARKLVKWKAEETFSWLRSTVGAPYEAFQERLAHLKVTCQPHVHAAAKSSVEGICKKMSVLSKQYAQNVRETHLKLLVDPDSIKKDTEAENGRFRCHPAVCGPYSFTDAGKLPQIEFMQQDRDHVLLKHKTDVVRLTTQFLQKLEQLYRYNCVDDRKFELFLARSYCLMKRYNGYCEDFTSPHNSQGSLPVTVFESIQRNFGVTFECFASPLNCYFRQYCSAFPDTDGYFGSRGTFLDFKPVSGSFEMNPPFSEDLIDAAITHAEDLLAGTKEPMSFIIFVPEYVDDKEGTEDLESECQWLKRLENSRWKRKQVTIPPFEHEFRHGAQHLVSKSEASIRSTHATVVFWLQNEAGLEEWGPTEQKVDALIDSYRPGRERERDRQDLLAPERKNPQPADKAVAAAMASPSMAPT